MDLQASTQVLAVAYILRREFNIDRVIFDKKYIFLAESIIEDNLVNVPLINKPGVLIR